MSSKFVKIREYSSSDYDQVCQIYFNGMAEMFPVSTKMMWNGENPLTTGFQLSVLAFSGFICSNISIWIGLIIFVAFEALAIFAIYDLHVRHPT
jgi:hypothetical protein